MLVTRHEALAHKQLTVLLDWNRKHLHASICTSAYHPPPSNEQHNRKEDNRRQTDRAQAWQIDPTAAGAAARGEAAEAEAAGAAAPQPGEQEEEGQQRAATRSDPRRRTSWT